MAEKKLLTDGLDKLVNISIDHNNLAQSYTLFDFLLTEGGKIKKNSFSKMLKLAVNTESEEDILSCARIGQKLGLLTNKVLKKQIFPNLHNCPELVVTRLEDAGVERKFTVTPMIKWLIGQGKIEDANSLAGIFLELLDLDEIYHCLLSRHCQKVDIEGASKVLQMMCNQGIKISLSMFHSLITSAVKRHKETRDIVRSHSVIKQWDISHSLLSLVYSSAGDWESVEKILSDFHSQGLVLGDEEYQELICVMSLFGDRENFAKFLSIAIPDTLELGNI